MDRLDLFPQHLRAIRTVKKAAHKMKEHIDVTQTHEYRNCIHLLRCQPYLTAKPLAKLPDGLLIAFSSMAKQPRNNDSRLHSPYVLRTKLEIKQCYYLS
ncbi:hypothetical protein D3C77_608620 [compost metagenome]